MAGLPSKRVVELIDLTLDDDDDDGATNAPTSRSSGIVNGYNIAHPTSSHAPAPPADYFQSAPPPKRVKLTNGQYASTAAHAAVFTYAEAGAKQAVAEDPHLLEAVLREKLHLELLRHFESRITYQNGAISESLHGEIIAVGKALLARLVALQDCRQLPRPTAPAPVASVVPSPISTAAAPRYAQPPNPYDSGSANRYNGLHSESSRSPVPQVSSYRPPDWPKAQGLRSATLPEDQAPPTQQPAYANGHSASQQPQKAPNPRKEPSGGSCSEDEAQRAQPWRVAHPTVQTQLAVQTEPAAKALVQQALLQEHPVSQPPIMQPQNSSRRAVSRETAYEIEQASTPRHSRQRRNVPNTPDSAKQARTNVNTPTTPQNFHSRAKTAQWKSNVPNKVETRPSSYFALERRPYAGTNSKEAILRGNGRLSRLKPTLLQRSEVFHVDFSLSEVHKVLAVTRKALGVHEEASRNPHRDLAKLLKKRKSPESALPSLTAYVSDRIPGREADDIRAFLDDVMNKRVITQEQHILSIEKDPFDKRGEDLRESRLASLLLAGEISGRRYGGMRRLENFTNEFHKILENGLQIRSEFTNCAGDISTISWISNQTYIAGTTVHMDSHNQQYNKPGNLVLGSISRGNATLKAYADHRVVRPIVQKGENSSSAMRETQDPWLYTSVVFSDYDPLHDRAFTSSFDKTVKAWKIDSSGGSMRCIGTWEHQGPANFVQASSFEHPEFSLVATAADVPTSAVRVYKVGKDDSRFSASSFTSFSCSRINMNNLDTDKWTYCPSTMKWGLEDSVKHYLLVGYSPRSILGDDGDIPPESLNTGELCLWDAITGKSIHIRGANSQNVFEVLWHPYRPVFIAATSAKGIDFKDNKVKTQVRIFGRSNEFNGDFSELKALDCMAADINELTIMPNSVLYSYVTAGCTDGKTYVWDTALTDKPTHVLAHGPPLEGIRINDAEDDTGVKFTAWGSSLDRFYTGSSDGVVKVWNVRSEKKARGKVILEASAQISFGAFSPDRSRLVVGDASGRVFVLSVDEDDGQPPTFVKLPGALGCITRRQPTEVRHHTAPPPPPGTVNLSGVSAAREFLAARQLRDTGDPTIGAVKDVNYASTGFFRREFHYEHDPTQELFAQYAVRQLEDTKIYSDALPSKTKVLRQVTYTPDDAEEMVDLEDGRRALIQRHERNCKLDLKFENLSLEIRDLLSSDGVGQRELWEGPEYHGMIEGDEVELERAKIEPSKEIQDDLFLGSNEV
ncbi:hypothetical protein N0V82_001898 [Gnomoniopsis sp. IMI 355080]|nr:hypothetical protein N0V82_001898 [Gnomoniopsis sp. IMI 355080]